MYADKKLFTKYARWKTGNKMIYKLFLVSAKMKKADCSPTFPLTTTKAPQISRSVVSDSLRPHESQNARPPCPSPTPGVHSDSRPSSQ